MRRQKPENRKEARKWAKIIDNALMEVVDDPLVSTSLDEFKGHK